MYQYLLCHVVYSYLGAGCCNLNSGKFALLLLFGCSVSCINAGHGMILGNASSSTKISMTNLPMYSIRYFDLEIEDQGCWGFGWKLAGQGRLIPCICVQKLAPLGPAVCSQYNHELDDNLPVNEPCQHAYVWILWAVWAVVMNANKVRVNVLSGCSIHFVANAPTNELTNIQPVGNTPCNTVEIV